MASMATGTPRMIASFSMAPYFPAGAWVFWLVDPHPDVAVVVLHAHDVAAALAQLGDRGLDVGLLALAREQRVDQAHRDLDSHLLGALQLLAVLVGPPLLLHQHLDQVTLPLHLDVLVLGLDGHELGVAHGRELLPDTAQVGELETVPVVIASEMDPPVLLDELRRGLEDGFHHAQRAGSPTPWMRP